LVFCEESDEENGSNNQWDQASDSYWYIPPMNVLIQEAIENFNEKGNESYEVYNTNGYKTTFYWETTTA